MSETTSLPTLFGRFTAILSEHERFGVTLRRISAACPALESEHSAIAPDLQPGSAQNMKSTVYAVAGMGGR